MLAEIARVTSCTEYKPFCSQNCGEGEGGRGLRCVIYPLKNNDIFIQFLRIYFLKTCKGLAVENPKYLIFETLCVSPLKGLKFGCTLGAVLHFPTLFPFIVGGMGARIRENAGEVILSSESLIGRWEREGVIVEERSDLSRRFIISGLVPGLCGCLARFFVFISPAFTLSFAGY